MLTHDNPMFRVLVTLLYFEAVVIGLATPVMIVLDGTSPALVAPFAGGVALLALVAGATLKRPFGQPLGWLVQVGAVALGFLTPIMFVVGGLFAGIYLAAVLLGRRIAQERMA